MPRHTPVDCCRRSLQLQVCHGLLVSGSGLGISTGSDGLIWFDGDDFDGDGKHQDCSSVSR